MGAYFSIRGLKKDDSYVTGRIPSLNMYEANEELTYKYAVENFSFLFKWGIHILDSYKNNYNDSEWYSFPQVFYFYNIVMLHTEIEANVGTTLLFEPDVIRAAAIEIKLRNEQSYFSHYADDLKEQVKEELENFKKILDLLDKSDSTNLLIQCDCR